VVDTGLAVEEVPEEIATQTLPYK